MQIWEIMVVAAIAFVGWAAFAIVFSRNTEQRIVHLALDIADGLLEDSPIDEFALAWFPRFDAALKAISVDPSPREWRTVIACVRDHAVAHALARAGGTVAEDVAKLDTLLVALRSEGDRRTQ
jgi:hypothetical protein